MTMHSSRQFGFTLIELMIAVLVVGVLMAIAYPSYQNHAIKTRRAAAAACTVQVAQFMERFRATNLSYLDSSGNAPTAAAIAAAVPCIGDQGGQYTIGLAAGTKAMEYSITAAPQGRQQKDTKCGTLALNQAGLKSVSVTGTSVSTCW